MPRRIRLLLPAALGLVALVAAACGDGGGGSDGPTATDAPCIDQTGDDVATFETGDIFFEPACATTDRSASVVVENVGAAAHTFTVSAGDLDLELLPGEDAELGGPIPLEPGTYTVTCTYHPGMTLRWTIEDA